MTHRGRRGTAVALTLTVLTLLATPPASAKTLEPWWYTALGVEKAHQQSTGKGVRIAVIDGALNAEAPELEGADVTLRKAVKPGTEAGLVAATSHPSALYAGHGTAMTTLIAGQGTGNAPGGAGITGIAPDAEVLFYQMDPDPTDPETVHAGELFDQAIKDDVDIISFSFTRVLGLDYALKAAADAGIVVVAGGGEPNGVVAEPASTPGVVAVGAVGKDAQPWSKQPEGYLTVVAPGIDVASGIMRGPVDQAEWVSGEERTGTSDATPLVAGALALVKSKYPDSTGNQLIQQLIHSTGGDNFGYRSDSGFGVINLQELLARDPVGWPDENPLVEGSKHAYDTYPPSVWKDPDATPEPTPATGSADDSSGSSDAEPAAATSDDDSAPLLPWTIAGVVVAAALVGGLVVARRRHTSAPALTGTTGGTADGTE